jgi:hypothetical protein
MLMWQAMSRMNEKSDGAEIRPIKATPLVATISFALLVR